MRTFKQIALDEKITKKNLSKELIKLIDASTITVDFFVNMANGEKFSQEELNDIGYMEDKIEIYEEMFEDMNESTKSIAEETFRQLGGQGRLKMMIGAKDFAYDSKDGSISFKFKRSNGINYIKVRLNGNDLYNIEFGSIVKFNYKVVKTETEIYAEDLKKTIEQNIKQYLSL